MNMPKSISALVDSDILNIGCFSKCELKTMILQITKSSKVLGAALG